MAHSNLADIVLRGMDAGTQAFQERMRQSGEAGKLYARSLSDIADSVTSIPSLIRQRKEQDEEAAVDEAFAGSLLTGGDLEGSSETMRSLVQNLSTRAGKKRAAEVMLKTEEVRHRRRGVADDTVKAEAQRRLEAARKRIGAGASAWGDPFGPPPVQMPGRPGGDLPPANDPGMDAASGRGRAALGPTIPRDPNFVRPSRRPFTKDEARQIALQEGVSPYDVDPFLSRDDRLPSYAATVITPEQAEQMGVPELAGAPFGALAPFTTRRGQDLSHADRQEATAGRIKMGADALAERGREADQAETGRNTRTTQTEEGRNARAAASQAAQATRDAATLKVKQDYLAFAKEHGGQMDAARLAIAKDESKRQRASSLLSDAERRRSDLGKDRRLAVAKDDEDAVAKIDADIETVSKVAETYRSLLSQEPDLSAPAQAASAPPGDPAKAKALRDAGWTWDGAKWNEPR